MQDIKMSKTKLPKDWKWVKLSEIGKIISGGTPSTTITEYWEGNINWIAPSDLTGYKNIRIKSGKKSITELGLKKSSARLMPKGSVLFSCRAPIGYTVIADDELCTNQGFKSIIPYDFVDSLYIYYFLKGSKQEAEKVASGTTFKEISLKSFSELSFPLPPLQTQQAIVSKIEELFSELDKGIEDLKTAQQQLKTYRQSVLKWAFKGKLTNGNVKDGELPNGWEIVKLGDECQFTQGIQVDVDKQKFEKFENSVQFLRIIDFTQKSEPPRYIENPGSRYLLNKAEIAMVRYGTVGFVCTNKVGAIANNLFKITPSNRINPKFLISFFNSDLFRSKLETKGATMQALNFGLIKPIPVPLPPLEQQHRIVQEIESRLSVADKMEESIAQSLQQAEALRQSILKKAFSGELV